MIKQLMAAICLMVIVSCSIEEPAKNYVFRIGESYINTDDNGASKLSDIYDLNNIISLETNDLCLIGQVSKLIVQSDRIIILDKTSSKVFVFSSNGTHLHTSQLGKGPYEVSQVSDFTIYENNLYLLSTVDKKIVILDLGTLEPREEIKTDFYAYNMESDGNGIFAFLNATTRGITITNSKFRTIFANEYSRSFEFILPLHPFIKTTGQQQQVLFRQGLDSLYQVNKSGMNLEFTFDFGSRNVRPNDIKNAKSERDLYNTLPSLSRSCFVNNFFLDNHLAYYTFLGFGHKEEVFHCLYNCTNDKKLIFSDNNIVDDIFMSSRIPITSYINESQFYCVKDPTEIPEIIREKIPNYKTTNNPIIFILTLNSMTYEKIN